MSFSGGKRDSNLLNNNSEIRLKDKNDDYIKNCKREIDGKIFEIKNKNMTFNEKVNLVYIVIYCIYFF